VTYTVTIGYCYTPNNNP